MKFKIFITILLIISYFMITNVFQPVFNNDMALKQFDNSDASFTSYVYYQNIMQYSWIIVMFIIVLIYNKEIIHFLRRKNYV